MTDSDAFTSAQLEIVRFCAVECELQMSGERSVWWMIRAWRVAMDLSEPDGSVPHWRRPAEDDIRLLGAIVEPEKNKRGYRQVGVRVGWDVKIDWRLVPRQMTNLVNAVDELTPAEWFFEYENVHPFVDGNGRTGAILFNWLNGTLDAPVWPPNFWGDERRVEGAGA